MFQSKDLRRLAEIQHGVISREQSRAAGLSRGTLRRTTGNVVWERVTTKVLRLAGTARTFEQACMAAVLDAGPGSAISHVTAAALWQLPGFSPCQPHVSRRRGRRRASDLGIIHELRALPDHHMTEQAGIPVTTVARTIFDLAGSVHASRAERALDNSLARGLTTLSAVGAIVADLAEHGRPGSSLMRRLLTERDDTYVAPDSGLEAKFLAVIRDAGLPPPARQRNLGGDRWVGRVDFVYADRALVIEIDSSLHHSSALDRAADAKRDAELAAAGFRVQRISGDQVWQHPAEVVAAVRIALSSPAHASPCIPRSGGRNAPNSARFDRQNEGAGARGAGGRGVGARGAKA